MTIAMIIIILVTFIVMTTIIIDDDINFGRNDGNIDENNDFNHRETILMTVIDNDDKF